MKNWFSKASSIIAAKEKSWVYKEKTDFQIFVYIIKKHVKSKAK